MTTPCAGQNLNHHRLGIGPNGGNFLALDGDQSNTACGAANCKLQGRISQTLTNLPVGGKGVQVFFHWAAGQQASFFGNTTEQLEVSLCPTTGCQPGDTLFTSVFANPQAGFSGWMDGETQAGTYFTFVPTSPTEVLSFLAIGTPTAQPPFVLLDGGIEVVKTPEPGAWLLLGIGFAAIIGVANRGPKWFSLPA